MNSSKTCTTDSEEETKQEIAVSKNDHQEMQREAAAKPRPPTRWTLEKANSDPFHFLQFLTPHAKEKFDDIFTGRSSRGIQTHGKNMK